MQSKYPLKSSFKSVLSKLMNEKENENAKVDPFSDKNLLQRAKHLSISVEMTNESFIGKGSFGDVYAGKDASGGNVAVKVCNSSAFDKAEVINTLALSQELNKKNSLRAKASTFGGRGRKYKSIFDTAKYYKERVNVSEFGLLEQKSCSYGLVSDLAEHKDLKDFFLNLSLTPKQIAAKDPRIVAAFQADPAGFLSIFTAAMRDCIIAEHMLSHIHCDVSARNFILGTFRNSDFKYDWKGNVIGLLNAPLKLNDQGRAKYLKGINATILLPKDETLPLRWVDSRAIINHEATIMTDLYSLKAAIITLISLSLGDVVEGRLLSFMPHDSTVECAIQKTQCTNQDALTTFFKNAVLAVKSVIAEKEQLQIIGQISQEDQVKLKTAQGCLVFLAAYQGYLTYTPGLDEEEYKPSSAKSLDDELFIKVVHQFKGMQKTGYPNTDLLLPEIKVIAGSNIKQVPREAAMPPIIAGQETESYYRLTPSQKQPEPIEYALTPSSKRFSM